MYCNLNAIKTVTLANPRAHEKNIEFVRSQNRSINVSYK